MKLTITGNYLVVTETNNKFLFRAPTQLVRVKERPDGKLKVYTETSVERQNHEVIIDPATATDGSGAALTGGLLAWLMTNTGTLKSKPLVLETAPLQVIDLSKTNGSIYTNAEWNATYTTTGAVAGGNATLLIDTTGEAAFPSVTGATLVTGSDFEADETFEKHVYTLDGIAVRYFFLKIS